MQSGAEENSSLATNVNATLNGTASLVQQQEPLAKRIAKHYPVANAMIAIFDTLGMIIFLSGFLYFFKEVFVYVCCNVCCRVCVHENKKNTYSAGTAKVMDFSVSK